MDIKDFCREITFYEAPRTAATYLRDEYQRIYDDPDLSQADKYMDLTFYRTEEKPLFRSMLQKIEAKLERAQVGDVLLLHVRSKPWDKDHNQIFHALADASPELRDGHSDYACGTVAVRALELIVRGGGTLFPEDLYIEEEQSRKALISIDLGHDQAVELLLLVDQYYECSAGTEFAWKRKRSHIRLDNDIDRLSHMVESIELFIGDEVTEYAMENDLTLPSL